MDMKERLELIKACHKQLLQRQAEERELTAQAETLEEGIPATWEPLGNGGFFTRNLKVR